MDRLAQRALVAQQRHKTFGKVAVVRQRPERRTIAVDHQWFAVLHAL